MSANPKDDGIYMTEAEYLEFERNSDIRHEYIQGEVVAMAGANPRHNDLTMTLSFLLYSHLRGKNCKVYAGDQRVKIEKIDTQYYPDLSVVCGDIQFSKDTPQALLNPIVLIEVLSPSTEKFDRGKKFQHYRQLPSLKEYVLVSQDAARIEHFYLQDNGKWEFSDAEGRDASVTLNSIGCTLALGEVYENVTFEESSE